MDKIIYEKFPLSANKGGYTGNINAQLMHSLCKSCEPVTPHEFEDMLTEHQLFINSGGSGGSWQTLVASGLVFGIYMGGSAIKGTQINLLNKNLTQLNLGKIEMPYGNFANVYFPYGNFAESNLKGSLFTDSVLDGVDFSFADLSYCDFSRAVMKNCNFTNANLSGIDMENCDLTGSNFTNAVIDSYSKFPGAILNAIVF